MEDIAALEERLSHPTPALVQDLAALDGDLLVLGAGGKMGPSLARMACRALQRAGSRSAVVAVSRFATAGVRAELEAAGVRTLACDLLERAALDALPEAAAVIFMAGVKFGSSAAPARTWALNAWVPALVAERFAGVPTAIFSSGNVYPLVPPSGRGASEETPPAPLGEYAWSVLARERIFQHAAERWGTPLVILRLNYAAELRYGVLLDVATKVFSQAPIDLSMGYCNAIWQGDACAMALRSLRLAAAPARILNLTGGQILSIRSLAGRFGRIFEREPIFAGEEEPTALLADASRALALLGPPSVSVDELIEWVADWVRRGAPTLGRPTHYEVRDGRF